MALDAQGLFPIEPSMIIVVGALAGMTAGASHHLTGSRVEHIFTDRMGEYSMLSMTGTADLIDGGFGHGRMVGTMGSMTVVAGVRHLVTVFCSIIPLESRFMTIAADMALLPLQQSVIISGMGGMAGYAAVFSVTDQVIVR